MILPPVNERIADKERLIEVRRNFFDNVINILSKPPRMADKVMDQSVGWVPVADIVSNQPMYGTLVANIDLPGKGVVSYSLFHVGDVLRIGVLVPEFLVAAATDQHEDITEFWRWDDEPAEMRVVSRGNLKLVEWIIRDRDIYTSYINQELVILGLGHFNARFLNEVNRLH